MQYNLNFLAVTPKLLIYKYSLFLHDYAAIYNLFLVYTALNWLDPYFLQNNSTTQNLFCNDD